MSDTIRRLGALGISPWLEPSAGMFVWCRLPDGADASAIARYALAQGIVLAPGTAFSLSRSASSFLRFNVAQSADERIYKVLADAMRSETASPSAGMTA
jgi:DNA-binding transcriptional MocR family regulator